MYIGYNMWYAILINYLLKKKSDFKFVLLLETAMGVAVNALTTDSDYVKWANR